MKFFIKLLILVFFGLVITSLWFYYKDQKPLKKNIKQQMAVQPVQSLSTKQTVLPKQIIKPIVTVTAVLPKSGQDTLKYVSENFNLPKEIKQDLDSAKTIEDKPIESKPQDMNMSTAKTIMVQTKAVVVNPQVSNLISGYCLSDKAFGQLVAATEVLPPASVPSQVAASSRVLSTTSSSTSQTLPITAVTVQPADTTVLSDQAAVSANNQSVGTSQPSQAQVAVLTSDALATNGLMAMADLNYAKAQDSFQTLLKNYPDSQEAPVVSLELARLEFEQNKPDEAKKIIDDAMTINSADSEYLQIAQGLRQTYMPQNQ